MLSVKMTSGLLLHGLQIPRSLTLCSDSEYENQNLTELVITVKMSTSNLEEIIVPLDSAVLSKFNTFDDSDELSKKKTFYIPVAWSQVMSTVCDEGIGTDYLVIELWSQFKSNDMPSVRELLGLAITRFANLNQDAKSTAIDTNIVKTDSDSYIMFPSSTPSTFTIPLTRPGFQREGGSYPTLSLTWLMRPSRGHVVLALAEAFKSFQPPIPADSNVTVSSKQRSCDGIKICDSIFEPTLVESSTVEMQQHDNFQFETPSQPQPLQLVPVEFRISSLLDWTAFNSTSQSGSFSTCSFGIGKPSVDFAPLGCSVVVDLGEKHAVGIRESTISDMGISLWWDAEYSVLNSRRIFRCVPTSTHGVVFRLLLCDEDSRPLVTVGEDGSDVNICFGWAELDACRWRELLLQGPASIELELPILPTCARISDTSSTGSGQPCLPLTMTVFTPTTLSTISQSQALLRIRPEKRPLIATGANQGPEAKHQRPTFDLIQLVSEESDIGKFPSLRALLRKYHVDIGNTKESPQNKTISAPELIVTRTTAENSSYVRPDSETVSSPVFLSVTIKKIAHLIHSSDCDPLDREAGDNLGNPNSEMYCAAELILRTSFSSKWHLLTHNSMQDTLLDRFTTGLAPTSDNFNWENSNQHISNCLQLALPNDPAMRSLTGARVLITVYRRDYPFIKHFPPLFLVESAVHYRDHHGDCRLASAEPRSTDTTLGVAVVDLGLLQVGLESIEGWYHLLDKTQRSCGQILISATIDKQSNSPKVNLGRNAIIAMSTNEFTAPSAVTLNSNSSLNFDLDYIDENSYNTTENLLVGMTASLDNLRLQLSEAFVRGSILPQLEETSEASCSKEDATANTESAVVVSNDEVETIVDKHLNENFGYVNGKDNIMYEYFEKPVSNLLGRGSKDESLQEGTKKCAEGNNEKEGNTVTDGVEIYQIAMYSQQILKVVDDKKDFADDVVVTVVTNCDKESAVDKKCDKDVRSNIGWVHVDHLAVHEDHITVAEAEAEAEPTAESANELEFKIKAQLSSPSTSAIVLSSILQDLADHGANNLSSRSGLIANKIAVEDAGTMCSTPLFKPNVPLSPTLTSKNQIGRHQHEVNVTCSDETVTSFESFVRATGAAVTNDQTKDETAAVVNVDGSIGDQQIVALQLSLHGSVADKSPLTKVFAGSYNQIANSPKDLLEQYLASNCVQVSNEIGEATGDHNDFVMESVMTASTCNLSDRNLIEDIESVTTTVLDDNIEVNFDDSEIIDDHDVLIGTRPAETVDVCSTINGISVIDVQIPSQPDAIESIPPQSDTIGVTPPPSNIFEALRPKPEDIEAIRLQHGAIEVVKPQPDHMEAVQLQPDHTVVMQTQTDAIEAIGSQPEAFEAMRSQYGAIKAIQPQLDHVVAIKSQPDVIVVNLHKPNAIELIQLYHIENLQSQTQAMEAIQPKFDAMEAMQFQSDANEALRPQPGMNESERLQPDAIEEMQSRPNAFESMQPQPDATEARRYQPVATKAARPQLDSIQVTFHQPQSQSNLQSNAAVTYSARPRSYLWDIVDQMVSEEEETCASAHTPDPPIIDLKTTSASAQATTTTKPHDNKLAEANIPSSPQSLPSSHQTRQNSHSTAAHSIHTLHSQPQSISQPDLAYLIADLLRNHMQAKVSNTLAGVQETSTTRKTNMLSPLKRRLFLDEETKRASRIMNDAVRRGAVS